MQAEADISFYSGSIRNGAALFDVPLSITNSFGGTWKWGWVQVAAEDAAHVMGIVWTDATDTADVVDGRLEFRHSHSDEVLGGLSIPPGPFPPTASGSLRTLPVPIGTACCVSLSLVLAQKGALAEEEEQVEEKSIEGNAAAVKRFAEFSLSPNPHDVVLKFPSSSREIWTSEALLRLSPYFADLFSSGFSESTPTINGDEQPSGSDATELKVVEKTFDDSDDEVDSSLPPPRELPMARFTHKEITLHEAAFSTYLAVVCFLQCGSISFAPLRSTRPPPPPPPPQHSPSTSTTPKSRPRKRVRTAAPVAAPPPPTLPLPVSPKSVYRLAHFLSLPTLSTLALSNFTSQLTPSNVTTELFDPFCALYPEARDAVLDYVAANRKEVSDAEETKKKLEKLEELEGEGEEMSAQDALMWAKLAKRLMQ